MSDKSLEISTTQLRREAREQRISSALRKATREARNDILTSYGYHALWLGQANRERYISLLNAHWAIRREIESRFDSLNGEFQVRNIATGEEKIFAVDKYVTPNRRKAWLLEADIKELTGSLPQQAPSLKAQELINYMTKVSNVYSAGLLGILYMLEETVAYAGPLIAKNIDRELSLQGKGTRYLRGDEKQKQDIWEFRRSLDLITDFQTQVNVVTAAAITYDTYRGLIDPRASLAPPPSMRLN